MCEARPCTGLRQGCHERRNYDVSQRQVCGKGCIWYHRCSRRSCRSGGRFLPPPLARRRRLTGRSECGPAPRDHVDAAPRHLLAHARLPHLLLLGRAAPGLQVAEEGRALEGAGQLLALCAHVQVGACVCVRVCVCVCVRE